MLPIKNFYHHCVYKNLAVPTHSLDIHMQVSCPPDYRKWLETMYSLFGNKWLNIHGGPMWKVETTEQGVPTSLSTSRKTEDVSTFGMSRL